MNARERLNNMCLSLCLDFPGETSGGGMKSESQDEVIEPAYQKPSSYPLESKKIWKQSGKLLCLIDATNYPALIKAYCYNQLLSADKQFLSATHI